MLKLFFVKEIVLGMIKDENGVKKELNLFHHI